MATRCLLFLSALLVAAVYVEAAPRPFFDAVYDAVVGNGRRTYGYNGYGYNDYTGYGYNGYGGYDGGYDYGHRREVERAPRREKTYKDLCRVHFPDAVAQPGRGGITCPY